MGKRKLVIPVLVLVALYIVLLIPSGQPELPELGDKQPFIWNQGEYWDALEIAFLTARAEDPEVVTDRIDSGLARVNELLTPFVYDSVTPEAPLLGAIEREMFGLSASIGARPERLPELIELYTLLRRSLKHQSRKWDMNSLPARNAVYRLLYGGRTAIEEIMLQSDPKSVPALVIADNEPSQTPSAEILGVKVHSGDILVSRGGAPTSALIARGSDYPGNFSHVALVHVDETTAEVSIVEAHIEIGVAIATIDQYMADKKLRVMVLRMRSDHPQVAEDPLLPHKAATMAVERARTEHIPYDFEMDFADPSKLFCSEVASSPYSDLGVTLWMGISHISTEGVASWLAAFGVTHFKTQEPSDLEYDPQLRVVAEWRDPETLWKDHVDNAVIDIMLEGAEDGDRLEYDWYMLPFGRLAKLYSATLNQFGSVGPVPEGMDAAAALRNDRFSKDHGQIKERLLELADGFREVEGYSPPYWRLIQLARQARLEITAGS